MSTVTTYNFCLTSLLYHSYSRWKNRCPSTINHRLSQHCGELLTVILTALPLPGPEFSACTTCSLPPVVSFHLSSCSSPLKSDRHTSMQQHGTNNNRHVSVTTKFLYKCSIINVNQHQIHVHSYKNAFGFSHFLSSIQDQRVQQKRTLGFLQARHPLYQ